MTTTTAGPRAQARIDANADLAALAAANSWTWQFHADGLGAVARRGSDSVILVLGAENGTPYEAGAEIAGQYTHKRGRAVPRWVTELLAAPSPTPGAIPAQRTAD